MKLLGISFGRKGRSCDILTKHALLAAKALGAQVKFINTIQMDIGHCRSCAACIISRDRGGPIQCALKDDYAVLEDAVLEADAILITAPVYAIGPVGQLKNFIDRFGPAHDIAGASHEQEKRRAGGKPLLDERMFSDKYIGYISVGGAVTHHWVSMGLPGFKMFAASSCWTVVGQMDVWDMGRRANPAFDEALMAKAAAFGRHMAMCDGKKPEEIAWFGDEGICPVCHNRLISISPGERADDVECPLCGIRGTLQIADGKIKVVFGAKEQNRARGKWEGQLEHYNEINSMVAEAIPKLEAHKDSMKTLLAPYETFEDTY